MGHIDNYMYPRLKGESMFILGEGTSEHILDKISSIPCPVFPLAKTISSFSQDNSSIISSLTSSGCALGKSILFIIGIIFKSCSNAKYKLEIVCASIPCAASTIKRAPSHARRRPLYRCFV